MRDDEAAAAAAILSAHRRGGTRLDALPSTLRPHTRRDGYRVQAHLGDDANLFGWKIAATSIAGQNHIGVSGPLAGRIFTDTVIADGGICSLAGNGMRLAEPEFAFRMAQGLLPREKPYTVDEVLAAVESLHPAIELPDTRFEDVVHAGEAQIIADNACAHRFVLGPTTQADWRSFDLVTLAPVAHVSTRYSREGIGAAVLGDPRVALAWLANELSSLGTALRAGEVVTTGTCCAPLDIRPGETLSVDFGPLGGVLVRFAE